MSCLVDFGKPGNKTTALPIMIRFDYLDTLTPLEAEVTQLIETRLETFLQQMEAQHGEAVELVFVTVNDFQGIAWFELLVDARARVRSPEARQERCRQLSIWIRDAWMAEGEFLAKAQLLSGIQEDEELMKRLAASWKEAGISGVDQCVREWNLALTACANVKRLRFQLLSRKPPAVSSIPRPPGCR